MTLAAACAPAPAGADVACLSLGSVVIPAYNEENVLGRCLDVLISEVDPTELQMSLYRVLRGGVVVGSTTATSGLAVVADVDELRWEHLVAASKRRVVQVEPVRFTLTETPR